MNNFKMIVSYDGTRYYGWEHQPNTDMTIQGKLETVLTQMLETTSGKTPDRPVTVIGAGRTDAGVHARAMTANVLLDTDLSAEEIQKYMNRYLPDDISVNEVKLAAERFHSRFKATGKTYRYTLWYSEDGKKPVFDLLKLIIREYMKQQPKVLRLAWKIFGLVLSIIKREYPSLKIALWVIWLTLEMILLVNLTGILTLVMMNRIGILEILRYLLVKLLQ